jgi:AcrR family transcriptional regulator
VAVRQPAHRPSRREEIIDAAIAVFSQKGYLDASLNDVAVAADVATTAIYYHFSGKDDLYGAAIAKVLDTVNGVVASVRTDESPAVEGDLHRIIEAVWRWVDENPDPAQLIHLHSPAATPQAAQLRRAFDDLHAQRAFAYLSTDQPDSPRRRALTSLGVRTLVDVTIAIHPMRMAGGPLSDCSPKALQQAVKALSERIVLTL